MLQLQNYGGAEVRNYNKCTLYSLCKLFWNRAGYNFAHANYKCKRRNARQCLV